MKKLLIIVFALAIGIMPAFNSVSANGTKNLLPISKPSQATPLMLQNTDFLGGFTEAGIDYYVYGSGLDIHWINASYGVVIDWSNAYLFVTDGLRINGLIETTNGNFYGNGRLLWQ